MILPEGLSTRDELAQIKQFKTVFGSLEEGAFLYDQQGNILLINAAAVHLLGLSSDSECIGHPYGQYLHLFEMHCGEPYPLSSQSEPLKRVFEDDSRSTAQAKGLFLRKPDGQQVIVDLYCVSLRDSQHQPIRGICVIHPASIQHQETQQLQQTLLAVLTLADTFSGLLESSVSTPEAVELFSSDLSLIAQQLVDLIHQQLKCNYAQLLSLDFVKDRIQIVAVSGCSWQQEQRCRNIFAKYPISTFLPAPITALLQSQGIVMLPFASVPMPPELRAEVKTTRTILLAPLLIKGQLIGGISIGRESDAYPSLSEMELVQAITMLALLVVKRFHLLKELTEIKAKECILRATNQRMNTFLDLASHELRTPLTVIMGNMQLAQRRLQHWTHQQDTQQEQQQLASITNMLDTAMQGARLQERMINDIIDDAQIQAHSLIIHRQPVDLRKLVCTATRKVQQNTPEHDLLLIVPEEDKTIMVNADEERLRRVINTYLVNALNYSTSGQQVKIELSAKDAVAYVSVHDEGPGIPIAEQEHLWERFYRTTGLAVQHELDLSLGLGLYLCRTFIELQGGKVGLKSTLGQGSTFWFTLPIQQSHDQNN